MGSEGSSARLIDALFAVEEFRKELAERAAVNSGAIRMRAWYGKDTKLRLRFTILGRLHLTAAARDQISKWAKKRWVDWCEQHAALLYLDAATAATETLTNADFAKRMRLRLRDHEEAATEEEAPVVWIVNDTDEERGFVLEAPAPAPP